MKKFMSLILVVLIISLGACKASYKSEGSVEKLLKLCNDERSDYGLAELIVNESLSKNAQVRADEIAETGNFSHIRPDGSGCFTAVTVDYSFIGENLAKGDGNAEDIFEKWMASPDHKDNILNGSYTQTGFGYSEKDGVVYLVQLFLG